MITIPELESKQTIMDANVSINLFLNRDGIRGNFNLESFNLCKFVLRTMNNNILLESFTLPSTYVMPRMEIVYHIEKISWANRLLAILGALLALSSLVLWLNKGGKQTIESYVSKIIKNL